jgi:hypothetical protein
VHRRVPRALVGGVHERMHACASVRPLWPVGPSVLREWTIRSLLLSRTAFDVAETDARADAPAMQHQYAEAKKKFGTAEKKYRTAQVSTPWVLYAVAAGYSNAQPHRPCGALAARKAIVAAVSARWAVTVRPIMPPRRMAATPKPRIASCGGGHQWRHLWNRNVRRVYFR